MVVPAPPDAARELFGARLPLVRAYAELLAGPGVERGLIGPSETERLWDRHLLNSGVLAELIPVAEAGTVHVADLGSGAGLPGVVLAILRPDARFTLIEPMARRTVFLLECVAALGLRNVEVRRSRAEESAGQVGADVVTSRAVTSLDRLAVLAAGLARPGGLVLAIKGAAARDELDLAMPVLQRLGATGIDVVKAGAGLLSQPTTVVRFRTARNARVARGRTVSGTRNPQGRGSRSSTNRNPPA